MALLKTTSDFFALHIGSGVAHVVQLKGAHKSLARYGMVQIDKKITSSDAPADKKKLAEVVSNLIVQSGITTKNVVVSVPADKSFLTVVDLPKLSGKEMDQSIAYQADQFVPMSTDEAKIDWAVLGDSPEGLDKTEVLIASVGNDYAEGRLDMFESLGLNVIAMEPEELALVRALVPPNFMDSAILLNMGEKSTDLVAVLGGMPRLIRTIPTGGEAIVKAATQNLSVDDKQAVQFVYKFGLVQNKLEGQVLKAIQGVVDGLIEEVNKSIKFFSTRYKNNKVTKLIVTGELAILPEFPLYLVNKTQIPVEIGNSWMNVEYSPSLKNELASKSYQYSVAVGLAERLE